MYYIIALEKMFSLFQVELWSPILRWIRTRQRETLSASCARVRAPRATSLSPGTETTPPSSPCPACRAGSAPRAAPATWSSTRWRLMMLGPTCVRSPMVLDDLREPKLTWRSHVSIDCFAIAFKAITVKFRIYKCLYCNWNSSFESCYWLEVNVSSKYSESHAVETPAFSEVEKVLLLLTTKNFLLYCLYIFENKWILLEDFNLSLVKCSEKRFTSKSDNDGNNIWKLHSNFHSENVNLFLIHFTWTSIPLSLTHLRFLEEN